MVNPISRTNSVTIGGIELSTFDRCKVLELIDEWRHESKARYLCFCEANLLAHAAHNQAIRSALNGSTLTLADGVIFPWLARCMGTPPPQRIPGPAFMLACCAHGLSRGYRHFFYGGAPGVADDLAGRLSGQFPGLQVAGTYAPPFRDLSAAEETAVRERIEAARPDLVWVGLSGPKQVQWMARQAGVLRVPLLLGVGAAFDFHSGRVPWAPAWIRRIGMEWAFRMLTGGRRVFLRNLWCLPQAARIAFAEIYRSRFLREARWQ